MGCVWQEYQVLLEHLRVTPTVAVLTGSGMNFMIGRVSYTLGLQGMLQSSFGFQACICPGHPCPLWASPQYSMAGCSHDAGKSRRLICCQLVCAHLPSQCPCESNLLRRMLTKATLFVQGLALAWTQPARPPWLPRTWHTGACLMGRPPLLWQPG